MTYEGIRQLNLPQFKRFCGVGRETFRAMVSALQPHLDRTGKRGGQPKLSVEVSDVRGLQFPRSKGMQQQLFMEVKLKHRE
jgi:hypothetical protein